LASLDQRPTVGVEIALLLDEEEARALHALTEYGTEPFLETFYRAIGESCLKPHEKGLRSVFRAFRAELMPILARAKKAREAFDA
jgi:hypothetical protein